MRDSAKTTKHLPVQYDDTPPILSGPVNHTACSLEGCCQPWSTLLELLPAAHHPPMDTSTLLLKLLSLSTRNVANLATDLLSHSLVAPKRPSWDIRLATFVSFFRQAIGYQHMAKIQQVRRIIAFPTFLSPSQVVITPASFRVFPRHLPGLLAECDALEDGSREITAEWVVERSVWVRNQQRFHDVDSGAGAGAGGKARWGQRRHDNDNEDEEHQAEKVVLYFHGGAYVFMSAKTHRELNFRISKSTGLRVFAINYRLAPENPFPAALADAVYSLLYLTDPNGAGIDPSNIVVMGDSAGGGLAMAMMLYLRDHDMDNVGAGCLLSPWVDLAFTSPTWNTNVHTDYLPPPPPMTHPSHPVRVYLGPSQFPHLATHPYVSPLYARTFASLPPLLIQCGDAECLHGEIAELVARIRSDGRSVDGGAHVQFEEFEDMVHVFQAFHFLPAASRAIQNIGSFVRNVVPFVKKHRTEIERLRRDLREATQSGQSTPLMSPTITTVKYPSVGGVRASRSHPDLRELCNMTVMGGGLRAIGGGNEEVET